MTKLFSLLSVIILLEPAAASAQTVVITRAPYKLNDGMTTLAHSEHDADLIAKKTAETAESLGAAVSREALVCGQKSCLRAMQTKHNADEALCVTVEQISEQYEITLKSIRGDDLKVELLGTFDEALAKVAELTKKALEQTAPPAAELTREAPEQTAPPVANPTRKAPEQTASPVLETGPLILEEQPPAPRASPMKRSLHTALWISLGITSGLAAGTLIIEGIEYPKFKDFQDKTPAERTNSERNTLKNMRTAELSLFVASCVGGATTVALGVLAAVKKRKSKKTVFLVPEDGGLTFQVQGSF